MGKAVADVGTYYVLVMRHTANVSGMGSKNVHTQTNTNGERGYF